MKPVSDIPQEAIKQAAWRSDSLPDRECRCLHYREIRVVLEEALPILRQQWASEMREKIEAVQQLLPGVRSTYHEDADSVTVAVNLMKVSAGPSSTGVVVDRAAVLALLDEGSDGDE